MINYTQYIKARGVGINEMLILSLGVCLFMWGTEFIGVKLSGVLFGFYTLVIVSYLLFSKWRTYKKLMQNGQITYGKVVSSKRTFLAYRGIINNKIKIEVMGKNNNIVLKSEYKMQMSVYKKYSNIVGRQVRVIIDFNDMKNHYIFHEDLFYGEGIRL